MPQTNEQKRAWSRANKERICAAKRAKYALDPEPSKAAVAKYAKRYPDKVNERKRRWEKENWEKTLESKRAYKLRHADIVKERAAKYRDANREEINRRALGKYHALSADEKRVWNYRISVERLRELRDMQAGCCAICHECGGEELVIDHCHETGHVRGLLCIGCNTGLGLLGDSSGLIGQAYDYLRASEWVTGRDEEVA
jgi:hypothetical protein